MIYINEVGLGNESRTALARVLIVIKTDLSRIFSAFRERETEQRDDNHWRGRSIVADPAELEADCTSYQRRSNRVGLDHPIRTKAVFGALELRIDLVQGVLKVLVRIIALMLDLRALFRRQVFHI